MMKALMYAALFVPLLVMTACRHSSTTENGSQNTGSIKADLSADAFEEKLSKSISAQLIDVRTPGEYAEGHLKGALNYDINSGNFEDRITKLDKTKPVFVYCLSGGRSAQAADLLAETGFPEVYNMEGGIMKWYAGNKPIEDGEVSQDESGMTKSDFNAIINSQELVLVDYNAKWCKPCQKMGPMLDAFAETRKGKLKLVKIDADENKSLLKENGVEAIPVLEFYKNGQRVWRHEGEISEHILAQQTGL